MEEDTSSESTDEAANETNDDESMTYAGTQETSNYFIGSHYVESKEDDIIQSYTVFSIIRDGEQSLAYQNRIERSLIHEDPSAQVILNSYKDLAANWPKLDIYFKEKWNELSTTSAQYYFMIPFLELVTYTALKKYRYQRREV
ncbi:hypothetical protein ATL39_3083 [Sinobaca qinghaiensis]|uniref:Uncharacterized protein n=1 Tax=Sinobaca qinghaiensis TaxID=342944 RepID=A0A419UWZ6_9BACL|nr:hypothetical protein [Sinobaca qinghaiensis]RKD69657.1 hypothetical protein ATL39_3083 [Sinobaca qinghaiensis]